MILSLNEQARLFLCITLAGALIAAVYDGLRIFRKMIPHNMLLIQLEDALYWLGMAFLLFFMLLQQNHGEIRFFVIIGAFLGMILYFLTLSPIINRISDKIVAIINKIIITFITILLTPFRLVFMLIRKPVKKTDTFIRKKMKKVLQFCKRYVKIKKRNIRRNVKILFHKK